MYFRYFMWNFVGRQNDIQGHGVFTDGNWLSGVKMIDEAKLGNRELLPEEELNNKGLNKYFFLPLLLGFFGLIYQLIRHPKDFSIVALLFLLTGLAIVVYLNQTPLQPRERDYAYSGSFYAFAIWIGLGVYALFYAATSLTFKQVGTLAAMTDIRRYDRGWFCSYLCCGVCRWWFCCIRLFLVVYEFSHHRTIWVDGCY